jgi:hypothetical protein
MIPLGAGVLQESLVCLETILIDVDALLLPVIKETIFVRVKPCGPDYNGGTASGCQVRDSMVAAPLRTWNAVIIGGGRGYRVVYLDASNSPGAKAIHDLDYGHRTLRFLIK